MAVTEVGERVYHVDSDSSAIKKYVVSWGIEGEFYSCTCHSYAFGRNKAGGMGNPFVCKHIRQVLDLEASGSIESRRVEQENQRKAADAALAARTLTSLLQMERELRE